MAIRILSSESISGNITIHSPSNAPYIDFVENADTGDSKARITMDQIDTNNGQLIFSTEKAGTLTTALTISQSQNVDIAGNLNLSVASSFITTSTGDIYLNPASNNTTLYDGTNAQIFNVYNAGNLSIKLDSVAGTYGGVLLNQAGTNFVHGISGQGLVLSHHNIGASNAIVSGDASNPDNLYINNGGAASDWSNVIIEGNVGYLDLRGFAGIENGKVVADTYMKLMARTDAVIVDLSKNGGGSPIMVQYLCSYFFDQKIHLNSLYWREGNETREFWTLDEVDGIKMPDVPLFIITSNRTFSGAEEFSYNMQTQKRATLVGQTTGGGANPGGTMSINENLSVFIPTGKAINPITKTNWEGIGVIPEVETTPEESFEKAHELAKQAAEAYRTKSKERYSKMYLDLNSKLNQYTDGESDEAILKDLTSYRDSKLMGEGDWLLLILYFLLFIDYLSFFDFP